MSAELYLRHFALERAPFELTASARFFFEGAGRGEILRALAHALAHEQGVVLVTGEVGTGKSALCRMLAERPPPGVDLVFLPNPSLTREALPGAIARDLGVRELAPTPLEALQTALLERHAQGRRVAVLVDEAQAMPAPALEEIRLLTNLESGAGKLLTFALFGQPELLEALARPELRALADRVTHHFRLEPLRGDEVAAYLQFRLHAAGHRGGRLFEPAAERRLARRSGGRSRRINLLADRALLACYARGGRVVSARDVARSERDLGPLPAPRAWRWLQRVLARPPRPLEVR
jgi:type II secretory pathway predicted ATPase ExeA